ncbi:MAG: PucR family transcriptional regulator ligand-binding domain-containing protein [Oscillospiraceae bacterium]
MSITVADCLQLPALREATVVAGRGGLHQTVATVSVLEYAHLSALSGELFLGNELILTAFTSVKDSVDEQCDVLRRLHEVGEVGIVLYYVGYFLPGIDPRLMAVADELDFPLMIMPPNTYHQRYSDAITEIMEAIFADRKDEKNFVTATLDRIVQMRERQRTTDSVLRLLSDRLRCSLLLLDRDGRERGFASWPMATGSEWADCVRHAAGAHLDALVWKEHKFALHCKIFDAEVQKGLQLYAVGEGHDLSDYTFSQAVEILQMYCNIWRDDFQKEEADDLVRAILNDQLAAMHRISEAQHITLSQIRVMWILKSRASRAVGKNENLLRDAMDLKVFLQAAGKTALADTFDNCVVAFMDDASYVELDAELAHTFMSAYQEKNPAAALIWCGGMDSTQDVRHAYMLMENCFPAVCAIFPNWSIFTQRELAFAQECTRILEQGEAHMQLYLEVLKPLMGQKDEADLLNTLSVYLIDKNKSVPETAHALYVHESTVKYRLGKIQQKLGYNINQMPGEYSLYLALALRRLMQ